MDCISMVFIIGTTVHFSTVYHEVSSTLLCGDLFWSICKGFKIFSLM
jgi:hypothetical protein